MEVLTGSMLLLVILLSFIPSTGGSVHHLDQHSHLSVPWKKYQAPGAKVCNTRTLLTQLVLTFDSSTARPAFDSANTLPFYAEVVHQHILRQGDRADVLQRLCNLQKSLDIGSLGEFLQSPSAISDYVSAASKLFHVDALPERVRACVKMTPFGRRSSDQLSKSMDSVLNCIVALGEQRQLDFEVRHDHSHSNEEGMNWKGVAAALVAWVVLLLVGLVGLLLVPLKQFPKIELIFRQLLVALGFGTLTGDALYHLLPHSLMPHGHGHHHHNTTTIHDHDSHVQGHPSNVHDNTILLKLTVVILGIVLFYLIEMFIKTCPLTRSHQCSCHQDINKSSRVTAEPDAHASPTSHISTEQHVVGCGENPTASSQEIKEIVESSHEHFFSSTVVVLLIGDALHHVCDGLAIGASFTSSWPLGFHQGLATSVAIIFHELPHKISDINFLVTKGYSELRATIVIFLSSSVSLIGVLVGVVASSQLDSAEMWINLFTAGMFLYIALVLMLSLMFQAVSEYEGNPVYLVLAQLVGTVIGLGIMLLIAKYEHSFTL